ncbi:MAG TPA: FtsW/RodA/SpoVE family cell cycle protein [Armatimonadota bacterium]|nr:FtsW/RodA/SpoVE family cell cycle protein [Armatimonadota bacterium]
MGHSRRATEGTLLLFAAVVLTLGFAFTFLAKLPQLDTHSTVNVNLVSPAKVASALMVDRGLAEMLCRHRPFANTDSISDVKLLTAEQVSRLAACKDDITAMSPGELATRGHVGNAVAERLVEIFAAGSIKVSASELARLPVVSQATISTLDSRLRVRDPSPVTTAFCIYIGLFLTAFFVLHLVLRRGNPNTDPYILPCVMMLAGIGAMMLFSIKDPLRDTDVFTKQVHGILVGIILAMIPLTAKFRSIRPWRYTYLYALLAIFLTFLLALFGTGPGGAKLKLFGFQPVELVKLALAFYVASYLADRWNMLADRTGPKRTIQLPLFRDIGPLAVMYVLSLATFILVRDLGPMLLMFGMFVAMLHLATGRPSYIAVGLAVVGVTGWLAYVLHLGVFDVRVDMWLHPWKNAHPNGMQLGEALWGLGTGGIWGSGLGLGQPAYMPRSGSDLIFASAGEELGLIGSLAILAISSILLTRAFRISLYARTDFDRFLSAGIAILLGIQVVIIVFGVLGLIPLTGVTFPFMSYGKSSLAASFFMAGLLLNVSTQSTSTDHSSLITHQAIRSLATGLVILLLGVAGIGRLVWIQGVKADLIAGRTVTTPDADGYSREHINPRLRAIEAQIPRGTIYDRNGKPLATCRASELEELGLTEAASTRPRNRYYPYGSSAAHLVGYFDPRCGGPVGFEGWRNHELRGFDDYAELLPIYRLRNTPYCPKIEGKDIRLTIDGELQKAVEAALVKYAGSVRDRRTGMRKNRGAAVVLDVYTGEVLAAASIPDFDPNKLTPGLWKAYNKERKNESIFVNRALDGIYPPGSTFKLVTASAALENGLDYTFNCGHQLYQVRWRANGQTYSRRRIADLEEMRPHGLTNLAKAVRVSCNVYFAQLGIKLGADRLYEQAHKYRLSRISPPGKLAEDLPDNAYGQGTIEVSPLEMARVVAAIANKGVMMKPYYLKEVKLGGQVIETNEPVEMGRPLTPESAAALRRMMADVVANGTGRGVFDGLGVRVGGKTGSAENDQADKMPHSWFVGFAPVEDPRIAFAVVVENGGYGRAAAGPICREIVRAAL